MSSNFRIMGICFTLIMMSTTGCLEEEPKKETPIEEPSLPDGTFVTGSNGTAINVEPLDMDFVFSDVGEEGAEPSIGVTSSGCIFFIAFEKPMRSCERSTDSGESWEQESTRISPVEVISATFPHTSAGDPGRIAITYLGSEDADALGQPNIDGEPWDGNAHYATGNVSHYLYVTYSLNALDENPIFHTQKVSADPVQVGSICLNSGDCRDIGGSNRNLLDFNDLHIDLEGRVYIAIADGCTGTCASGNDTTPENSRSRQGAMYYLGNGPSLYESVGNLTEFYPPIEEIGHANNSFIPASFMALFVAPRAKRFLSKEL